MEADEQGGPRDFGGGVADGLRAFAAIVAAGAVAFSVAAARLSRASERDARPLAGQEALGLARTVETFLRMGAHLHASSGDARFADRLEAPPEVVEELLADIGFVRHGGRIEEPQLVRVEVRDARAAGPSGAEVRTREYWVTRSRSLVRAEPVRSEASVVEARYALERASSGWRVVDWALDLGPGGAAAKAR